MLITKMHIAVGFACCAVLLLSGFVITTAAQTNTGAILGTVTDASGAAIPDATVRVTNTGTAAVQVATSDSEGRYRVPALPIGEYDVQVEKQGFQVVNHRGIPLTVGGEQVVDFALPVGQVTQTVTVEAAVPTVETTSSEISTFASCPSMGGILSNWFCWHQVSRSCNRSVINL